MFLSQYKIWTNYLKTMSLFSKIFDNHYENLKVEFIYVFVNNARSDVNVTAVELLVKGIYMFRRI